MTASTGRQRHTGGGGRPHTHTHTTGKCTVNPKTAQHRQQPGWPEAARPRHSRPPGLCRAAFDGDSEAIRIIVKKNLKPFIWQDGHIYSVCECYGHQKKCSNICQCVFSTRIVRKQPDQADISTIIPSDGKSKTPPEPSEQFQLNRVKTITPCSHHPASIAGVTYCVTSCIPFLSPSLSPSLPLFY